MWLPGSDAPAHLTGTLPGDFGFDPLSLGKFPDLSGCAARRCGVCEKRYP
jgi:hypothetical protein